MMKFMFETKGKQDRFRFSAKQVHLELSVADLERVQQRRFSEAERQYVGEPETKLVLPFVITNTGPEEVEIVRLEFCTWRGGALEEVNSRNQWYNGENFLPPGTMYSDRKWFNVAEPPDCITGQLSIELVAPR